MKKRIFLAVILAALLPGVLSAAEVTVVYGSRASGPEIHAANELADDIAKVYGFRPAVVPEGEAASGIRFQVGTTQTHSRIAELAASGEIQSAPDDPGPEAFIIQSFPASREIVIAGCDARGTLYGVYEYSGKILGIDPMAYWTGKEPDRRERFEFPEVNIRKNPPAFPLRGYFDNDSDMLANFKGKKLIIEFDLWKEIIDSAARLGYNFFDPFDTLGRPEFWVWPYYQKMVPDYHTDLDLVNRVIDYAHEKGLMIQVSTYLGYEFHHLPYEQKCLSLHYDQWIDAYRYLLYETPVGKADIIYQSPRDPWWDWPYFCAYETILGIDQSELHSNLLNDLTAMVKDRNPDAIMTGLLWSDGKKHWDEDSFVPGEHVTMVWSDDGYGRFPEWPKDFKGHRFGIYIHAGYYENHVVQDPYPRRIKEEVAEAQKRGMTAYYFVNGQDFKHFILNLEAAARAAWDPESFDPDAFYLEWAARYFGGDAAPLVVESLAALHESHNIAGGGFAHFNMENETAVQMAKFGLPYCKDRSYMKPALEQARRSLELARQARPLVPENMLMAYDDQILFPAEIYLANLELHEAVMGIVDGRCAFVSPTMPLDARQKAVKNSWHYKKTAMYRLTRLKDMLNEGSGWDKWEGWTKVENFRKLQPPVSEHNLRWLTLVF